MALYRLCFIDARGRISRAADLDAAGDEEAIRLTAGHDDVAAIELWHGDRKICRFEARRLSRHDVPAPSSDGFH